LYRYTEACHGASGVGAQLTGDTCAAGNFVTDSATCGANATCPGARNALGLPAVTGFEKVAKACSGRGTCDEETEKCTCGLGWAGADCNTRCRGASADSPCYNLGQCDKRDGACFCKPGFRGVGCNSPTGEAVETCACGLARAVRLASGATMQVCTGRSDGATCACREGWVGPNCDSYCPGAGPPALLADPNAPDVGGLCKLNPVVTHSACESAWFQPLKL
jgi:hypothetical protein